MASPTIAANAYASLARMMETGGGAKPSDSGGQSFGALLKDAVGSVLETDASPTRKPSRWRRARPMSWTW